MANQAQTQERTGQQERSSQQERRQAQGETGTIVRSGQGETGLSSRQYQDSFSLLDAMFERMQRDFFGTSLFSSLLPTRSGDGNGGGTAPRLPRTQVRDTGGAVELTVEMPGVEPDDVEVQLQDDVLTVSGESTVEEERDGVKVEDTISFYRQLELPDDVDPDQTQASYRNGVLSIRLPKRNQRQNAKNIPISTEAGQQGERRQSGQTSQARQQSAQTQRGVS
jgi:HSP20 family protein